MNRPDFSEDSPFDFGKIDPFDHLGMIGYPYGLLFLNTYNTNWMVFVQLLSYELDSPSAIQFMAFCYRTLQRRKHLHPKEVRLRWMEHDESSVKQVIFWDFLKQRQRTEEGMFSSCCQRFTIVLACNGCEDMFLVFVV